MQSADALGHHTKIYFVVGGALLFLTLVTVGVSYIHVSLPVHIAVALLVASVKGTLVAAYFMHLIDEKKAIYWVLILTAIFFVALMFLPLFTVSEQEHYLKSFGG